MRYVAAYSLFALSGKAPSAKDLEKLLGTVGVDCDAEQAKKVVSELEGKDLEELIKDDMEKLGTMPTGGGGAAAAPAVSTGAGAPAKEEAKEVKPEEPEEESDDDMGFGL